MRSSPLSVKAAVELLNASAKVVLMKITLTDAGKRFNRDWIFRHLHYEFIAGHSYAITGANGSGKSTLLQAVAGSIGISEGNIEYGSPAFAPDQIFRHLSIAAPYL